MTQTPSNLFEDDGNEIPVEGTLNVTGEEQTQDLLKSIDELDKGIFTVKDGKDSIEMDDTTEKEDFYEQKYKEYELNYDNQVGQKIYKGVSKILPFNLQNKFNNKLANNKQKALKFRRDQLKFAEENADNAVGQTVRGFLAAYPMALNEASEGGINLFRQIGGLPYKEYELFDIDSMTRKLTDVDPEDGNGNIFKTASIMTRFVVGSNFFKNVGNTATGGLNPVTGMGKFDVRKVDYSLKGFNLRNAKNFLYNRAIGAGEDIASSLLFLDAEEDNFFQAFEPLVEAVPQLDTAFYRFLLATDPEEEGFIQAKLKVALAEALPFQFGYSGVRGLNRAGKIGFKDAAGEVLELGEFLVDGTLQRLKGIKSNPQLLARITEGFVNRRGFTPFLNYEYLDEVKWNELDLDQKLDQLYKRNDIIVESLVEEDIDGLNAINRAIAQLDDNNNLTEENLKQLLDIKKFDEKAVPFKTKLDSGQGLVGNRGKDYLKQRLKFLNFRNTFKEARTLTGRSGNKVTLPAIKFQQLSDDDAQILNNFLDNIGSGRLNDVAFSLNSKIGAAGRFNFENKLVEINSKIFEEGDFKSTYVHELWHTLSRYLPTNDVAKLRKEFAKKRNIYLQNFDANKKEFINKVELEDLLEKISSKRFDSDNYMRSIRSRINREITNNNLQKANDSKLFKKLANDYFEANKFTNENYRYTNIDEYFAETMVDEFYEFNGRLPDAQIGTWKRLGQEVQEFFREMMANVRAKFGDTQTTKIFNDFNSSRFQTKVSELPLEYRNFDDMNKVDFITYKRGKNRPNRKGIGGQSGDGRGGDNSREAGRIDPDDFMNLPKQRKQFEKFSYLLARIKSLKRDGTLGKVKSLRTTIENSMVLLSNTAELKARGQAMAEILNIEPLDELNYALAEQITLMANKNTQLSKKLKMAIKNEDYGFVDANMIKVLDNMKEIDEWLEIAVPIGSKTGQGLKAMQIDTIGVTPEEWAKLSPAEKFALRVKLKEEVVFSQANYSKRFSEFQDQLTRTHTEAMKTGDYSRLDRLFGTLNRAEGDPRKLQKLFERGLLVNILNDKILHPLNDLSINLLLLHPTTMTINFTSNALEALFFGADMMADPVMLMKLFKGDKRMFEENLAAFTGLFADREFIGEVAKQSWLHDMNVINPRNTKLENVSERAFSGQMLQGRIPFSDIEFSETPLGEAVGALLDSKAVQGTMRAGSKTMTTMDGMFQAGAINGATSFHAFRDGMNQGLTGAELQKFVKDRLQMTQELLLDHTQKALKTGVIDDDLAYSMQSAMEFSKRQTFTEPMFRDGYIVGQFADSMNRFTSTSPLAKRFMLFLRSPVNITKRAWRRTPVINVLMPELLKELRSADPLVARQARGQLFLGNLLAVPAFAAVLMGWNKNDPENPPKFLFNGTGANYFGSQFERDELKLQRMSRELNESIGILREKDGVPEIGQDGKPVYDYFSIQKLDPVSQIFVNQMNLFQMAQQMPEQTFGEFMSSLAYYGIRSSLNKANLFGIQDMFKFVTDPKRMPTFIQRNILTSLQPRILKDIKKDIQLGQKNLGIMSETEFNRTRSQKLISNRFDETPFIRNFRILLDEYSTGRIEGRTKDGFRKFPYEREFLTNELVPKYSNKEGLNLLNFVVSSTSRNNPLITNFKILNYVPAKPIKNSTTAFEVPDFETGLTEEGDAGLPSSYYDQLVRYINESTFPEGSTGHEKYGNMNVEEALLLYFKQPHIQAHMEELERYKRQNKVLRLEGNFARLRDFVLEGDIDFGQTEGVRDIVSDFKKLGKQKFFFDFQDQPFVQDAIKKKLDDTLNYRESIKQNQTFKDYFTR